MSDMITHPPFMAGRLENEISFARLIAHLIIWSPDVIWGGQYTQWIYFKIYVLFISPPEITILVIALRHTAYQQIH